MRAFFSTLLLCLFLVTVPPNQRAEAKEEAEAESPAKRWSKYYQQVANEYELYRGKEEKDLRLTVSDHPLMSYSHPWGGGMTHGSFFVWTHKGCAEVIGAIWSMGPEEGVRPVYHEFHSFSTESIAPTKIGRSDWAPSAGVERKPIEGAAAPKENRRLRLAQMKTLSRQFTGYSTPHGKELKLRTSVQPVFRYDSESADVIDGAIFPMWAEWDPDIILLIEARKQGDEVKWYYAHGRFNGCPLRLEYKGNEVWNEGLVPLRVKSSNFLASVAERRSLEKLRKED